MSQSPKKLTPELAQAIVDGILGGAHAQDAAAAAGVDKRTFAEWKYRGWNERESGRGGRHDDLLRAIHEANMEAHFGGVSTARRKAA